MNAGKFATGMQRSEVNGLKNINIQLPRFLAGEITSTPKK